MYSLIILITWYSKLLPFISSTVFLHLPQIMIPFNNNYLRISKGAIFVKDFNPEVVSSEWITQASVWDVALNDLSAQGLKPLSQYRL